MHQAYDPSCPCPVNKWDELKYLIEPRSVPVGPGQAVDQDTVARSQLRLYEGNTRGEELGQPILKNKM